MRWKENLLPRRRDVNPNLFPGASRTPAGTELRTRLDGNKARRCRYLCGAWRLRQAEAGGCGAIRLVQRYSLERGGVPDYEPSGGRPSFSHFCACGENHRLETAVAGDG